MNDSGRENQEAPAQPTSTGAHLDAGTSGGPLKSEGPYSGDDMWGHSEPPSRLGLNSESDSPIGNEARRRLHSLAEQERHPRGLAVLYDPELPGRVVDRIDALVGIVRDKLVYPVERTARALVLAVLSLVVGTAAAVLLILGIFRLGSSIAGSHQWVVYLAMGLAFSGIGLGLLKKAAS
jgi:hypothetical protein